MVLEKGGYDVVIASGSKNRIDGNRTFFHDDHRVRQVHSVAPEKDCLVPEIQPDPAQEAIIKALAVAWLLKIPVFLGPEQVHLPFEPTPAARKAADTIQRPVVIVASDTTQKIASQAADVFRTPDIYKLDRDLVKAKQAGASKTELRRLELADKQRMKQLYTREFAVLWKVGGAWLAGTRWESQGAYYDLEILTLFAPLKHKQVDQVYKQRTAHKIGPRVDLAASVSEAQEILLRDRKPNQTPDQGWDKISKADLNQIVRMGILPYTSPSAIIELLTSLADHHKRHLGFIRHDFSGSSSDTIRA